MGPPFRHLVAAVAGAVLLAATGIQDGAQANDGVPLPSISRGQGEKCVADTDFMRRNHMDLLLHQRDQTVHEGERGERFSLKRCVACHAVLGPDGRPVTAASPRHFCRQCHDYAAVKIDCFECHASRPEAGPQLTGIKWTEPK